MSYDFEKYNIEEYLELISDYDEETRKKYVNAYIKYLEATAVNASMYDSSEPEKKMFKMKRYSKNDAVVETLQSFYYDLISKGLDPDLEDELLVEIDTISKTEASSGTQMEMIRYKVAEFAIEHGLDCYLFSANLRVFDDYYNRVVLSNQRRRGM